MGARARSIGAFVAVAAVAAAAGHPANMQSAAPIEDKPHPIDWLAVEAILKTYRNLTDYGFTAGDMTGRKFAWVGGNMTMDAQLFMASASKFPGAIAVAGAVARGHLSFDTRAAEVFPWWSADPADMRSKVTLRHLLSFTSGFYYPDESGYVPCMEGNGTVNVTPEECARQIYETAPFAFEPGTTWAYNSFHLQLAAAMAAKASNITVLELLDQNLISKLRLNNTGWSPVGGQNPVIAVMMFTSIADYDKILSSYLSYDLLPKEVADQMEIDYLSPPYASALSNSSIYDEEFLGHYCMCNWYECVNLNDTIDRSAWSEECKEAQVHNDLGLFGYYPIIDRKNQVYLQVGQQYLEGLNSTGLGCEYALIIRILVTPLAYRAMGKPAPPMPLPPTPPHPFVAASDPNPQDLPEMRLPDWPVDSPVWGELHTAMTKSKSPGH